MLISLFSILYFTTFAQDKITIKVERVSDVNPLAIFQTPKQLVYLYKVGEGDFEGIGHKGNRIEEVLKTDEVAYKEFKRFKRKLAIGKTFYWAGTVIPLTVLALPFDENSQQGINIAAGSLIFMLGSYTTTYLTFKNAPKHLHNAVMIYNQNLEK